MSNSKNHLACENCSLRKKAEAQPRSFAGRLWYWHIRWCPGWKRYQRELRNRKTGDSA